MPQWRERVIILLWPNLAGLELAPTTAKNGEEKKARAVASVDMLPAYVL